MKTTSTTSTKPAPVVYTKCFLDVRSQEASTGLSNGVSVNAELHITVIFKHLAKTFLLSMPLKGNGAVPDHRVLLALIIFTQGILTAWRKHKKSLLMWCWGPQRQNMGTNSPLQGLSCSSYSDLLQQATTSSIHHPDSPHLLSLRSFNQRHDKARQDELLWTFPGIKPGIYKLLASRSALHKFRLKHRQGAAADGTQVIVAWRIFVPNGLKVDEKRC